MISACSRARQNLLLANRALQVYQAGQPRGFPLRRVWKLYPPFLLRTVVFPHHPVLNR